MLPFNYIIEHSKHNRQRRQNTNNNWLTRSIGHIKVGSYIGLEQYLEIFNKRVFW